MQFLLLILLGIATFYIGKETYKETIKEFKSRSKIKCVIVPFPRQTIEIRDVENAEV